MVQNSEDYKKREEMMNLLVKRKISIEKYLEEVREN